MRLHLQVGCKTCFFWAVRWERVWWRPCCGVLHDVDDFSLRSKASDDNKQGRWKKSMGHRSWPCVSVASCAHADFVVREIHFIAAIDSCCDPCSDNWRPPLPGNWPTNARPAAWLGCEQVVWYTFAFSWRSVIFAPPCKKHSCGMWQLQSKTANLAWGLFTYCNWIVICVCYCAGALYGTFRLSPMPSKISN